MVAVADEGTEEQAEEYRIVRYREVYNNVGLKCRKVSPTELMEDYLGDNFSIDRERQKGDQQVFIGHFYGHEIRLKIVKSKKVLQRVYVQYFGEEPEKDADLNELTQTLLAAGLERKLCGFCAKH